MKIRPVGAELFHEKGRTDMTKLIIVFRNLRSRLKATQSKKYTNKRESVISSFFRI